MDEIHKHVLNKMMSEIMKRISDPDTLASCLTVLTPQDKEQIKCKTANRGDICGAQELVTRLTKRGANAYNSFLELLDSQENYQELAAEIRNYEESERARRLGNSITINQNQVRLQRQRQAPNSKTGQQNHLLQPVAHSRPYHSTPSPTHARSLDEYPVTDGLEDDEAFQQPRIQRANTGPPSVSHPPLVKQSHTCVPELQPTSNAATAIGPNAGQQVPLVQQSMTLPHRFPVFSVVAGQPSFSTVCRQIATTQQQVRSHHSSQAHPVSFSTQQPNVPSQYTPFLAHETHPNNEHLHSMTYQPEPSWAGPPHGAYPNYPSNRKQVAAYVDQAHIKFQAREVQETPPLIEKGKEEITPKRRTQPSTVEKSSPVEAAVESPAGEPSPDEPAASSENVLPDFTLKEEDNEEQHTDEEPHASGVSATEANTTGMLLKQIPVIVKNKVVKMLNHNNGHTWKDVAGPMGLSVGDLDELDNDTGKGKMEGLFIRMMQQQRTVSDLVRWLNHEDVQRLDVIDVFRKADLILPALERELIEDARVAEVDESPIKPPMPCTEEKPSVTVGAPILCSKERQTDANHTTPQAEIRKYNERQTSSPCRTDVVAKGVSSECSSREKILPSSADTAAVHGTSTSEKPKQCTEAKVSTDDKTHSNVEATSNSNMGRKENALRNQFCSPAVFSVRDDLDEGEVPTQCTESKAFKNNQSPPSLTPLPTVEDGASPAQCTSLIAVSSLLCSKEAFQNTLPTQATEAKGSLTESTASIPIKATDPSVEGNTPTQCMSLIVLSPTEEDSSAKNAVGVAEGNLPTECSSIQNAAGVVEGNTPTQCKSLNVTSSTKEDSSAKNAVGVVEGNSPTECSSIQNAAGVVVGNTPTQCKSLSVTSSAKEDTSAKNAVGVVEGNLPTECSSIQNTAGVVEGNMPTQCKRVTSSTTEDSSAKNAVGVVEGNLPTECSSIQNVVDVVKCNTPTQCSSLNTTALSDSSGREADTSQDNPPTDCTDVKSSLVETAAEKEVAAVESILPTQCSSLNVATSSAPVKEATGTPAVDSHTDCTQVNVLREDSYAEHIASSSHNVPSYVTETQVNQNEILPSDSHDSPVACTDVECSKGEGDLGIAFEEQGKVGDVESNGLSCLLDGGDDEDGDVFCSDQFGRCALILCCEKYESLTPLDGISQHAKELSELLEEAGWQVICSFDCSAVTMQDAVEDFLKKVGGGRSKACLVYLIGHTVQIQGDNHLLPVDVTTDLNRADVVHMGLSLGGLLTVLEEKSYLHVTFVDGAHANRQPLKCYGVFPGLAGVKTPPNCTVAFPCSPGAVRPSNERLAYIQSLIEQLRIPGLTLRGLLTNVANTMMRPESTCTSPPCDMSLALSLTPFAIVTPEEESRVTAGPVGIQVLPRSTSKHALIICNCRYENNSLLTSVYRDAQHLKHALDKGQWTVTDICDRSTDDMITEVRKFLTGVKGERRIVMVYFIGFVQQIRGSNFLFGTDWPVSNQSEVTRHAITTQWILNLMCEHVSGPRILVVDDMNTSGPDGLASLTVPQETLVSLPCAREVRSPELSYSLALAQRLGANPWGSLKEILSKNSMKGHKVEENLFFA